MYSDAEELMLEHLRYVRAKIDTMQDILARHEKHLDRIDRGLAGFRGDTGLMQDLYADHRAHLRSLTERVERIEHRLHLTSAPPET